MTRRSELILAAAMTVVFGCGGSGETGEPGEPGTNALVETETEPAGDNCTAGGLVVRTGQDADGDGALNDDEVEQTSYLCNGAAGDAGEPGTPGESGDVSLIETAEAANCGDAGGLLVRVGVDSDGDGALQPSEVTSERELCNAPATSSGAILLSQTEIEAGTVCFAGGMAINVGRDLDQSGVLDETEIESTLVSCNPCPLGYAGDPADPNQCVPAKTIVFEGIIDDVIDDDGLGPAVAVGDAFTGTIVLYNSTSAVDSNPDSQMGMYTFAGAPSSFSVKIAGTTLKSEPTGEVKVEINNDFGFTLQDEYRITGTGNAPLGTLTVDALMLELYDWDGMAFASDAMRVPMTADEAEQMQFTVVFTTGMDNNPPGGGPGPIGGSAAIAFGAVTSVKVY